jgi:pimeloyl-ACP methyl ester carboxylesterase
MEALRRDGVALFYEEAQGDEPPVLLVHGIACDHTIFAPQFEHFARRGQRVVAVDLRGHGKSDKPEQSYTMQLFTDDLAWMCEQIGLQKPVVIGHSMGGVVVLALASATPIYPRPSCWWTPQSCVRPMPVRRCGALSSSYVVQTTMTTRH